jgi:hypothetical protein
MAELNSKDRIELATIYEAPTYKSLKKWLDNERLNIATKLIVWAPDDVVNIAKFQGQADALKNLHLELRKISTEVSKNK